MSNKGPDHDPDAETPQQAGDNRRAGDMDSNATGGDSKSKGATNPPDLVPDDDKGQTGTASTTRRGPDSARNRQPRVDGPHE
jgi:hypothetical protein